jgi:hypothetical protein
LLAFRFTVEDPASAPQTIRMSAKVVDRITLGGSEIGFTQRTIPDGLRMHFYVDGVWIEQHDMR